MRRHHAALTLLALTCALTACSSTGEAGTSPATGSPSATSGATSSAVSATPSTTPSVDPSQDPLYLEAVDVYKKYFAEMQKFEAAGYPTRTVPQEFSRYMTPRAVSDLNSAISASIDAGETPKYSYSSEVFSPGSSGVSDDHEG